MVEQDGLVERVRKYIEHYDDAPNWGGPTMYPAPLAFADIKALYEIAKKKPGITALEAELARLREALTPSGYTKAAYIGEFSFAVEISHPRLGRERRYVDVPWTTIKEIMAAIRERVTLKEGTGA